MKTNKIAFAVIGALTLVSCGDGGSKVGEPVAATQATKAAAKPSVATSVPLNDDGSVDFQDIGVHDPSIVKGDDAYYIFGSHFLNANGHLT